MSSTNQDKKLRNVCKYDYPVDRIEMKALTLSIVYESLSPVAMLYGGFRLRCSCCCCCCVCVFFFRRCNCIHRLSMLLIIMKYIIYPKFLCFLQWCSCMVWQDLWWKLFINISNYNKPIQVNKFTNNVQTTFTFSSSIFVILWPKVCVTSLMF